MRTNDKSKIIEELKRTPIVEAACRRLGVSRSTYYRWARGDRRFAKEAASALSAGRHVVCDMAEGVVISRIKAKDLGAAKYWLGHNSDRYRKPAAQATTINVTRRDVLAIARRIEPAFDQKRAKKRQYKDLIRVMEAVYPAAVAGGLIDPAAYASPLEMLKAIAKSDREKKERFKDDNLKKD